MDEGKGGREREREKKSSSFLFPRLRAGVFLGEIYPFVFLGGRSPMFARKE